MSYEELLQKYGCIVAPVNGKSMLPLLREGRDLAVIKALPRNADGTLRRCKKYDAVLYKRNGRYILHRIIKVLPAGYIIRGDNCYEKEYDITDEQLIGVMVSIVRSGRELSAKRPGYIIYLRLLSAPLHYLISHALRIRNKLRRAERDGTGPS